MMQKTLLITALLAGTALAGAEAKHWDFESGKLPDELTFMWKPADAKLEDLCRITSLDSYRGGKSLELHTQFPKYYGIYLPLDGEVKAGETYTASAYVKNSGKGSLNIYIITHHKRWEKLAEEKFVHTPNVSSQWQQIKVTFTAGQDAKHIGLIIRSSEKTPQTWYLDDLRLEPGAKATEEPPQRVEEKQQQARPIALVKAGTGWRGGASAGDFF